MSYNGIFLLILVDYFISSRNLTRLRHFRFWTCVAVAFLLLYSVSDYNILGKISHMPSLSTYISFMAESDQPGLVFIQNLLTTLNLLSFIWIIVYYGLYLLSQERDIQEKLKEAARANTELKNYAALSEKIAQNRERKRIARDIHDTVGHALTGITAGIDATKMLIDINPQAAKTQLDKLSAASKQGLKDVRKTLNQMRPGALNGYTFEASLKRCSKNIVIFPISKLSLAISGKEPSLRKLLRMLFLESLRKPLPILSGMATLPSFLSTAWSGQMHTY